ncbi:uridine kinase family protein [Lentzea sp. CA-135723]|uniref:uridine kinase family protein n=1 Tax=Lentzea sp. CA-135723 TaxID=3239950 RepID=UPI003D9135B3
MRLHAGETEAAGWRVVELADVVRRLREEKPGVTRRPLVVAVDGRGGAGKSTLAERLRAAVAGSEVVHTDDIAWNHACFDWGGLLERHVLAPLHGGGAVEFRPPAWVAHDGPGVIRVAAGADVVWIEGTGIIRAELAGWIDASIWVQGDLDEQERRLVTRDGDSAEQRRHVAAWLEEELPFMLRERPWDVATVVAAGTTGLDHDPERQVVVGCNAGQGLDEKGRVGRTSRG